MKNTIMFDLGGTLAHYYEVTEFPLLLQQAITEVRDCLLKEGMSVASPKEISRRVREEDYEATDYRIRPLEERLRRIFQLDVPSLSEELATKICRCFMKPIFARGQCYEDTIPVLSELQGREFKIGIVSNTSWGSPALLWREEINRLGLDKYVDAVVFCRDVGWRKPARQIFEFALRKLNASPQNCVFVGDNPKWDLLGPQAVGITPIIIDRLGTIQVPEENPIKSLHELIHRIGADNG